MIAISIVSHGQKDLVMELLADLDRIRSPLVKCIVITHNSCDDRAIFPSVVGGVNLIQLFNDTPKGFGANHNAAFGLVNQPFFAVLNPDLRFHSDPFEVLVRRFEMSAVALVGPTVLNSDGTLADSARRFYTPWESVRGLLRLPRTCVNPVWLAGMFLLFRSTAFESLGGFDQRYFMYVEDVDICSRITLAGGVINYEQGVSVIHDAQRANRKSLQHLKWHAQSAFKWWTSRVFWRHWALLWSK